MKILFVNACPRGSESRTLRLADILLNDLRKSGKNIEIVTQDLNAMQLKSVNMDTLQVK